MKKKTFLFATAVLCCSTVFLGTAADVYHQSVVAVSSGDNVDLRGYFKPRDGELRSGTDPIVAELQGSVLMIYFQKNVGTLRVTITGSQGEVYESSVNTATQSALAIPLPELPAGSYTITFSNNGGSMWGEFEM